MASCRQSTKRSLTDSAQLPYALKSDITQMYRYKGSVSDASKLPASGQWRATSMTSRLRPPMALPARTLRGTRTAWDALGGAFTIEECTNAEIDQIFTDLAAG